MKLLIAMLIFVASIATAQERANLSAAYDASDDPWRFSHDREPPCLVAIGDSISLATGLDSFVNVPGWEVQNIAANGTSVQFWNGFALDFQAVKITCDPAAVHVQLGSNDAIGTWTTPPEPEAWRLELIELVDRIDAHWPEAEIFLSQEPQRFLVNPRCETACLSRLSNYREQLLIVVEETRAHFGIDWLHAPVYARHFPDGVHPDQEAHDIARKLLSWRLKWIR